MKVNPSSFIVTLLQALHCEAKVESLAKRAEAPSASVSDWHLVTKATAVAACKDALL